MFSSVLVDVPTFHRPALHLHLTGTETFALEGHTALIWSARRGHDAVLQCLLEQKADPNVQAAACGLSCMCPLLHVASAACGLRAANCTAGTGPVAQQQCGMLPTTDVTYPRNARLPLGWPRADSFDLGSLLWPPEMRRTPSAT